MKGQPKRFILGHATRKSPVEYRVDEETGCWVWLKALTSGYGCITIRTSGGKKKTHRAHVVYWERANGPVPQGLQLDHLCHNRACVNPAHLEPVTPAENSRRGDRAKLDWATVILVRTRMAAGERNADLAREFAVDPSVMSRIRHAKRWS